MIPRSELNDKGSQNGSLVKNDAQVRDIEVVETVSAIQDSGLKIVDVKRDQDRKAIVKMILQLLCGALGGCFVLLCLVAINPKAAPAIVSMLPGFGDILERIFSPLLAMALGWYFGSTSTS